LSSHGREDEEEEGQERIEGRSLHLVTRESKERSKLTRNSSMVALSEEKHEGGGGEEGECKPVKGDAAPVLLLALACELIIAASQGDGMFSSFTSIINSKGIILIDFRMVIRVLISSGERRIDELL